MDCGLQGIDWTFRTEDMPTNRLEEARLSRAVTGLAPLDVRYHLFFPAVELGDRHLTSAYSAWRVLCNACELISRLGGRFVTVHVGLGRDSMQGISWEKTVSRLSNLTATATNLGIRVCLENLAWGWTARPELYEKLLRKSGCWGTLDIGHAQVCTSVSSGAYDVADFAVPNPERIRNAHIYHEETVEGHVPPRQHADIEQRLRLLASLPMCDWWVVELREEEAFLQTLTHVREFLQESRTAEAM